MTRVGRRGWLLLSGIAALVPVVALCRFFGRGWSVHASKREPKENDDDDEENLHDDTVAVGLDKEERERYHATLLLLKEKANAHFRAAEFDAALEMYQGCVDMCAALGADDAEAVQINQVVRANVALVFLKLQRPEEARMLATFLLQDDTHPVEGDLKVKVLYRRGLASQALGDRESALCDFRAAVFFSPGEKNPAAEAAIAALSRGVGT
ncbi:hypothetical protein TcG_13467 [Trypanosoma cruzi]|uniref:Uncharacterized protein n=2 Tax=Trypanosoma cruzi TaxID=5693 RepID=V5BVN3_TRYCR|nr:hypothetical protein TCDM_14031 [Trypanosoma cruzi Dm28c]KAF8285392.1 hypothetical protein TcBrA4_0035610 [Trypanosoma cruzi]PBJ80228.1 hypothetical protein BCY84_01485 [Trypanosoma cruzi cruzi]PWU96028.1 hypothetical protein C4B63_20g221 [Trypanosoma cruzi]RNE95185.1 hypothetical protein TcG_13467 [Trypanosoma cruzi]